MIFASPGWQRTVINMNAAKHHVGIFKVPTFANSPQASKMYEDTPGFQVTRFAKNKTVAGNFLAFIHSPARMAALYNETGDIQSELTGAKRSSCRATASGRRTTRAELVARGVGTDAGARPGPRCRAGP